MIFFFILAFLSEASFKIPLHYKSKPLYKFHNSLRSLSSSNFITNDQNTQYFIETEIGTPPQDFVFLLSLTTSWIAVDAIDCEQCRDWTKKFSPSQSLTYKSTSKYLTLETVGQMKGYAASDSVSIGKLTAKSQGIILVNEETGTGDLRPDGVLGLGFSSSNDGGDSLISTLYNQNDISSMIFSLYLNDSNSNSDLPNKGESMLIIDGYDISKYAAESDFTFINAANSNGYWQMDYDYTIFDNLNFTGGSKAIISPGTSWILGPKVVITSILKQLYDKYSCNEDDKGQIICNCNEKYPDLILIIDGFKFKILSAGYMQKINEYCYPAFDYSSIANTWVLGDVFLRRFYTLFDMAKMRIGFTTVGLQSQISKNSGGGSGSGGSGSGGSGSGGSGSGGSGSGGSGSGGNETNSTESKSSNSVPDWQLAIFIAVPISLFAAWVISLVILYRLMTHREPSIPNSDIKPPAKTTPQSSSSNLSELCPSLDRIINPNQVVVNVPIPEPLKECGICQQWLTVSCLRELSCSHYFCESDLKRMIEYYIEQNSLARAMRCPHENCPGEIGSLLLQDILSEDSWNKLNIYMINRDFRIINCPNCHQQFESPQSRRATCINCQYEFCTTCSEIWHEEGDCQKNFIKSRIRDLERNGEAVSQCPGCKLPYIKDEGCEHVECMEPRCKAVFCFTCACYRSPTMAHGNHYHRPDCRWYAEKPESLEDDYLPDRCSECAKLGHLCYPPRKLRIQRKFGDEEF